MNQFPEFKRVFEVVKQLRDPQNGCPWDLKQDHESLLKYLLEESYEYMDAVQSKNKKEMEEELGDVLLQVLLHSQIASETDEFNIESVCKTLADKLVRRHPHVFNNPQNKDFSIEEIKTTWEETKKNEGKKGNFHITEKDNLFPALHSASKIGAKTSKVNFDWTHYEQVIEKVEEELAELKEEIKNNNQEKIDEEMGDLLFSVAQLARHLKVEPEMSLHRANQKFITRFNTVEKLITEEGHKFTDLSHEQLEDYWIKSKNENK